MHLNTKYNNKQKKQKNKQNLEREEKKMEDFFFGVLSGEIVR